MYVEGIVCRIYLGILKHHHGSGLGHIVCNIEYLCVIWPSLSVYWQSTITMLMIARPAYRF